MNKRLWIVLGAIVVLFFGGLLWYKSSTEKVDTLAYVDELDGSKLITRDDIVAAIEKTTGRTLSEEEKADIIEDHYEGSTDAKVVVIKWEDFACSHCQASYEDAEQIKEDYKDQVLFITRDFSLNYPSSKATLSAGNAVAKLGGNEAFRKMSDLFFQDEKWLMTAMPTGWKSIIDDYATQVGVDVDEFNELLNNAANNGINDKIDRDKRLGENMNVEGTPTWMVNGQILDSIETEDIRTAIAQALAEAEASGEE